MMSLLALLPIILIFGLMVGLRWSAAAAGILGLIIAIGISVMAFGYGTTVHAELTPPYAIGGAMTEALFVAGTILWIIFPALCIFELQNRSGAFNVLKIALGRLSDDRRIMAILIGWFFALFMEGAAGFGTPVVLAAPILVGLGFAPVQAVALVLIGHAAGVSFGAIGTPIIPQMAITGFTGLELSRATGLMHALLGSILLVFLFQIAGQGAAPTKRGNWKGWGWAFLAAPCFLLPFLGVALFIGPELPTLVGALVGGVIFVAILRWKHGTTATTRNETEGALGGALWRASLPYIILLVLILATRLIEPLQQTLQGIMWQWSLFGLFSGQVQPFYHPGTMLLLAFVMGGLLQGRHLQEIGAAFMHAAHRILPVVIALVAMLGLSRVMVHAGMISTMAETAALAFGPIWPIMVPFVGVLGGFITGSATASNILLTSFQETTARTLGLPTLQLVSGQGFGAAVGNIVCPHNIIAGAATVGLHGREGEVLRQTMRACIFYAAAGGIFLYILTR